MRALALSLLLWLLPLAAPAQDAATTERDRSFLTGLLEDNLSGAGRAVQIEGFAGALSSRATFTQMTIADDQGIWLTLRDGAISWNRGALLSGRLEIAELSAAEIDLPRAPVSGPGDASATPEAKPFALPELPVSVEIGKISAARVVLGEALFGAEAVVSAAGAVSLAGGAGAATLAIDRVDGPAGRVALTGAYSNATRLLSLDLLVDEAAGGIASKLLGLPGEPAILLAISGAGPIDDFTADVRLESDRQPRLTGQVVLQADPDATRRFTTNLSGDLAPLLAPEYRAFFGNQVQLRAVGSRDAGGQLDLTDLTLRAQAMTVQGALRLLPSGLPDRADLRLDLSLPDRSEVLLPLAGEKTWVRAARVRLGYDRAQGENWALDARLDRLRRAGFDLFGLRVTGSGRILQKEGVPPAIGGTLDYTASGIAPADPALAQAVGPFLSGRAVFSWAEGQPLRLPRFRATGRGYGVAGRLALTGPGSDLALSGAVDLRHSDLTYLSGLAGRPMAGQISGQVSGSYALLSGALDGEAELTGTDVAPGIAPLDRLLAGRSRIAVSAQRDGTGITLRDLSVTAGTLTGQASGALSSSASDLGATLDFADLRLLGGGIGGRLSATAALTGPARARTVALQGEGRNLALGLGSVDRVLAGTTRLSATAQERGGRFRLTGLRLENPQLTARAESGATGANRLGLTARLANLGLILPEFPGPLTVEGTADEGAAGYAVALRATGPASTRADISGQISADFARTDLALAGSAEAALANPFLGERSLQGPLRFDLRLNGAPGLPALSGRVSLDGARFADPGLGLAVEQITAQANLSGGRAQISGAGNLRGGGSLQISGPLTLSTPYPGELRVVLDRARLRDPELFDTRISGTLSVSGPLTGGARIAGDLTLDDTELRVPSTGLGGVAPIPQMTHLHEPADVRATRARAGLVDLPAARPVTRRAWPLDITLSAPRQIFVRGRGLDAELGGALRLGGTTAAVIPAGQFDLIRGRLDILGKRFTLTEGLVQLQGALIPYISFAAVTQQDDVTTRVAIEGAATEPTISFTSSPELPEEEVLARLLFGRGLNKLSAFQAAQMASAVATLAGKGGEGLVGRLRSSFGLDDFDLTTDDEGTASLRAGKYLSENVYTDVILDADGKTQINLNLDVSPNLTARGSVGADGGSGIGIYYEKDY